MTIASDSGELSSSTANIIKTAETGTSGQAGYKDWKAGAELATFALADAEITSPTATAINVEFQDADDSGFIENNVTFTYAFTIENKNPTKALNYKFVLGTVASGAVTSASCDATKDNQTTTTYYYGSIAAAANGTSYTTTTGDTGKATVTITYTITGGTDASNKGYSVISSAALQDITIYLSTTTSYTPAQE